MENLLKKKNNYRKSVWNFKLWTIQTKNRNFNNSHKKYIEFKKKLLKGWMLKFFFGEKKKIKIFWGFIRK